MLFGIFFAFWRFVEIITLIPTLGMLAWFVHQYDQNNLLTPDFILVLFIVSVLGAAWAIATLFTYHRAKSNALFVSFIDLCFVGAFIGAVYELRDITKWDCTSITSSNNPFFTIGVGNTGFSLSGWHINTNKTCAMLKACFAFGIMNCIFFAMTSLLALLVGRGSERHREKDVYVRESHVTRHGHRRSGSHRSHRSSHSGRRHAYV